MCGFPKKGKKCSDPKVRPLEAVRPKEAVSSAYAGGKGELLCCRLIGIYLVLCESQTPVLLSFQDADLSRNVPGKVKVSAPNLQKIKKK